MKCPQCESTSYRKNGHRSGRQNYLCKNCGRQFLDPTTSVLVSHNGRPEAAVSTLPNSTDVATQLEAAKITSEELLKLLLSPELLESSSFQQFMQKFQQLKEPSEVGIAILLLDAENLKLDRKVENFLAGICNYPLQVKIAFANWRNPTIGKQDAELYDRGYQLIHVPSGSSSADAKMIAIGSSIFLQYPNVKEVFVCSGDGLLTHLCNELQNKGLTTYLVQRQDNILSVENRNTGTANHYSIAVGTEIPSVEGFVSKIEDLLEAERTSISDRIAQLSAVATLFQERRHLSPNSTSSNGSPTANREPDEVNSVVEEKPTQLITEQNDELLNAASATILTPETRSITSKKEFEQALILSFERIKMKSPTAKISVGHLGTEFRAAYNKSPSSVIKSLGIGSNFIDVLQSCSAFKVQNTGNGDEVELTKYSVAEINSLAILEQVLVDILKSLINKSKAKSIAIVNLATEFNKQRGVTISAIIKHLKFTGNFTQFLQSSSAFKLEQLGASYQVAIADS